MVFIEANKTNVLEGQSPTLSFINSIGNSIYITYDPLGIKPLNRLLQVSAIYANISSGITLHMNPLCPCSLEIESTERCFLHCKILIAKLNSINGSLVTF